MLSYENLVSRDSDYYIYTASLQTQNLFFYPTYIGCFHYLPGYLLSRNRYDSFLIMLITEGTCEIVVDNKRYTASKGNIVILDCYHQHEYSSKTGYTSLWLHFDGPLARSYYQQIVASQGTVFLHWNFHGIYYMMEKIYLTFKNGKPISEPQISTLITTILNDILTTNAETGTSPAFLKDTITYINEHFSEEVHLDDLAAMASLSPFYFTRVFAKETGMTPYQYLIATRLSFSKLLLKGSDFSIKEIAFRSGFSDESRFCSSFKKHEGLTPSQYRQK